MALFISYKGTLPFKDKLLKRNCSSTLEIDKHIKRVIDLYSVQAHICIAVKQAPTKTKNIGYLILPRKGWLINWTLNSHS